MHRRNYDETVFLVVQLLHLHAFIEVKACVVRYASKASVVPVLLYYVDWCVVCQCVDLCNKIRG